MSGNLIINLDVWKISKTKCNIGIYPHVHRLRQFRSAISLELFD